jgi:tRNA threonylcarbamoyladenosine biosynthesis protein TsaE
MTRLVVTVPDAAAMQALARDVVAPVLRAGDLVLLSGGLGAGKTTFTQGLGAALGVRGPIASPTFIIARTHPSEVGGPGLVHVDAYRLSTLAELDDLDLDASLDDAVTVVEWGDSAAALSEDRIHITIDRAIGEEVDPQHPDGGDRKVTIATHGSRWDGIRWAGAA